MTEVEKNLLKLNGVQDLKYEDEVVRLIRRKYSFSQELALERQRYRKPEEFAEYDAYCEQCKADAKAEVYGK